MNLVYKILKESELLDFNDLNASDYWLAKYTYEGKNKFPSKEILRELLENYPVTEETIIYRGINFTTKEQFENFIIDFKQKKIKNIAIDGISSWSPDESEAEQFAITQPSYILNSETLRLHSEADKENEYVTGFCGVIISHIVKPGKGINVNLSDFTKENEIILIPGTYKIELKRILKKFKDQLENSEASIDDVIDRVFSYKGKDVGPMLQKFYDYIIQHHKQEIKSPELKTKIFQIAIQHADNILDQIKVIATPKTQFESNDTFKGVVNVYYNYAIFSFSENGIFNKEDLEIIIKYGKKIFDTFKKIIKKYPDYEIKIKGLELMAKVCNIPESEIAKLYQNHIGTKYNQLNSREQIKKINSIKDPEERRKTMSKLSGDIQNILKQLS